MHHLLLCVETSGPGDDDNDDTPAVSMRSRNYEKWRRREGLNPQESSVSSVWLHDDFIGFYLRPHVIPVFRSLVLILDLSGAASYC